MSTTNPPCAYRMEHGDRCPNLGCAACYPADPPEVTFAEQLRQDLIAGSPLAPFVTGPVLGLLDFPAHASQTATTPTGALFNPADIARASVDLPQGVTARLLNTDTGDHVDLLDTGEIVGPTNTIGTLSKETYDPTWMDDMPVSRMPTKGDTGGFETFGEMRKRDATVSPAAVRDALGDGYMDPTAPVTYTNTVGGLTKRKYSESPELWNESDLDPLRAYLRVNAAPWATAEQVAAALGLLTDDDRALVTATVPTTRPIRGETR